MARLGRGRPNQPVLVHNAAAVAGPVSASVDTAALALAAVDVVVAGSGTAAVAVDTAVLTLAGVDTTIAATGGVSVAVDAAALTLSAVDPTVSANGTGSVAVDAGALTIAGVTPTATGAGTATISVDQGALTVAGVTPTVSGSGAVSVAVDVGAVTIVGVDTTLTAGAVSIAVDPGALSATGVTPTASGTGAASVAVDVAAVALSGVDVTASGTGAASVALDPASVAVSGQTPTPSGAGAASVAVDSATLTITAVDVSVEGGPLSVAVDTAVLTITPQTPVAAGTGTAWVPIGGAGPGTQPLRDDFERVSLGTVNWIYQPGEWAIVGDTHIEKLVDSPDNGIYWRYRAGSIDHEASVLYTASGVSAFFPNLFVRVADPNQTVATGTFYGVTWSGSGSEVLLYKDIAGTVTPLKASVTFPLTTGVTYQMTLRALGSVISFYVNGVLVDTATDGSITTGEYGGACCFGAGEKLDEWRFGPLIDDNAGLITISGVTPTASISGIFTIDPATVSLAGVTPTVSGTGTASVAIDTATITLTGVTPAAVIRRRPESRSEVGPQAAFDTTDTTTTSLPAGIYYRTKWTNAVTISASGAYEFYDCEIFPATQNGIVSGRTVFMDHCRTGGFAENGGFTDFTLRWCHVEYDPIVAWRPAGDPNYDVVEPTPSYYESCIFIAEGSFEDGPHRDAVQILGGYGYEFDYCWFYVAPEFESGGSNSVTAALNLIADGSRVRNCGFGQFGAPVFLIYSSGGPDNRYDDCVVGVVEDPFNTRALAESDFWPGASSGQRAILNGVVIGSVGGPVDSGALTITGQTPAVAGTGTATVAIDTATIVLAGVTPTAAAPTTVAVDTALITITAVNVVVTASGTSTVSVDPGAVTLQGVTPDVSGGGAVSVAVDVATISVAGADVAASATGGITAAVDTANLSISGVTPAVSVTGTASAAIDTAVVTLSTSTPLISGAGTVSVLVPSATITVQGVEPGRSVVPERLGGTATATLRVMYVATGSVNVVYSADGEVVLV